MNKNPSIFLYKHFFINLYKALFHKFIPNKTPFINFKARFQRFIPNMTLFREYMFVINIDIYDKWILLNIYAFIWSFLKNCAFYGLF